jgi:hypothetical protein
MRHPNPALFALYRGALRLYPSRLRLLYQDQLLQTVRDAHAERNHPAPLFWLYLFADLLRSSIREHLLMIRDQAIARPIFFHALTLGLILTLMGGAAAATFQGMLRRGADQPQIQMADSYASKIAAGAPPERVILMSPGRVDLQQSLEPFAIFYNDQGVPITAGGFLNQTIPTPPDGVFNYVRAHGDDHITWQPQPGVRIAAIFRRVDGSNPGFVLAGRSLRAVEEEENLFFRMVFIAWFIVVALLVAGGALLNHAQTIALRTASTQG